MKLLVRWAALAFSFWVATALIPGIDVKGGFTTYLWVALLFGLLNATLGSLLKLLTLPAVILTLGLFLVVVNAAMLMLVARCVWPRRCKAQPARSWELHQDLAQEGRVALQEKAMSDREPQQH